MSHSHSHHHHSHEHGSRSNIKLAIWLNTLFAVVEIVGGLYTNSVAILSDALHDLGDSVSLGLAYYFEKKSVQGRDENYSYGYKRFSLLGAFISSLILVIGSVFIITESIERLSAPEAPHAQGMFVLAAVGLIVNLIAMLRLKKGDSITERVLSLHFLEDVLGWAAVLVGSVVMMMADIPVLDPILSLLIAGYILLNVYKNLRDVFRILLQGTPETIELSEIKAKILAIPQVVDTHDIHTWTMDGRYNVMTLHVVVQKDTSAEKIEAIKKEIRHSIGHMNIQHMTIETEPEDQSCTAKDVHHAEETEENH